MKLVTDEHRTTMLVNTKRHENDPDFDLVPIVTIFNPLGVATYSLDRGVPDIADGLCDLGFACPEIG